MMDRGTGIKGRTMSPEADQILRLFRVRDLRAGDQIHPADFDDAIVWKDGFIRDESVRQALAELFERRYLIEHAAALELTTKGEQHIYAGRN
jgi:hypothetical protein